MKFARQNILSGIWIKFFAPLFICASLTVHARPRLIVITDIGGDPDDSQSMVRLLVHANEFEIEGLLASASGTPGELKRPITRADLIAERVAAYAKVLPMLRKHDARFPSARALFSVIKSGNKNRGLDFIGEGHDTEGSDFIIEVTDRDNPSPVNIAIWGGQTDVAQALWRVKHERSVAAYQAFADKVRIYDINDQDHLFSFIHKEFSEVRYILAKAPQGADKRDGVYRGMYLGGDESLTSTDWLQSHVTRNHGPLGALYPDHGLWTAPNPHGALKEGDTPSWFYFMQNGLSDARHPQWGGWGGRFEETQPGLFLDAKDHVDSIFSARASVWRWRAAFQNDFAARMDWCISDYDQANHHPRAIVQNDSTNRVLEINVQAGESLMLSAAASYDPDGDSVLYRWWIYNEASNCPENIFLKNNTGKNLDFAVPKELLNCSIHIILQATDNGTPPLTSYRRIIVHAI